MKNDNIENKLKTHFGEDWEKFLNEFIYSQEYDSIGTKIINDKKEGVSITPDFADIFRCFRECPILKLHTVILGMDPYPGINKDGSLIADGIAFSARYSEKVPKSLEHIFEALDISVFNGEYSPKCTRNYDLKKDVWDLKLWANQGILLINCAFTTVINKPSSSIELWKPFTNFLLKRINEKFSSLGIILMGGYARKNKSFFTNETFKIFECEHPAAAAYRGGKWQHNNVFLDLTNFQKEQNNIHINW